MSRSSLQPFTVSIFRLQIDIDTVPLLIRDELGINAFFVHEGRVRAPHYDQVQISASGFPVNQSKWVGLLALFDHQVRAQKKAHKRNEAFLMENLSTKSHFVETGRSDCSVERTFPFLGITLTRHARHFTNRWASAMFVGVCAFSADGAAPIIRENTPVH